MVETLDVKLFIGCVFNSNVFNLKVCAGFTIVHSIKSLFDLVFVLVFDTQ